MPKTGGKPRKRKRKEVNEAVSSEISDSESVMESEDLEDKYTPFRLANYHRSYPENSAALEFIVFLQSNDDSKPIGDRDMMSLSSCLKRNTQGIRQLKRINKYKIGIIFDKPSMANACLANQAFLDEFDLKATIPASPTEITGVITSVPINLSNKKIYTSLQGTSKIIYVRRFMKKMNIDDKFILQPTTTVSITFASTVLPESVDMNLWRFPVSPYIPPVKQCFRCLRFGHIAKFCKNACKCSICGDSHNYKECNIDSKNATCFHCKGNHIAISTQCPIKKKKIEQNQTKARNSTFADLLKEKSFPPLPSKPPVKNPVDEVMSLINSEQVLNLLVQTIIKIITLNKSNEKTVCSKSIEFQKVIRTANIVSVALLISRVESVLIFISSVLSCEANYNICVQYGILRKTCDQGHKNYRKTFQKIF